jgi:hypothetical protein
MTCDVIQAVHEGMAARAVRENLDHCEAVREIFKRELEEIYDSCEEPIGKQAGQRYAELVNDFIEWCRTACLVAIPGDAYTVGMYLHLKRNEGLGYPELVEIASAISRAHYNLSYADPTAHRLVLNVIANIKKERD